MNISQFPDLDLVQRSLGGDAEAVQKLQEANVPYLCRALANSGATEAECDEIVGSLWTDCLAGGDGREPLFHRYTGKAPLKSWLAAIVTNRWISRKRREKVHARAIESMQESETGIIDGGESLLDPVVLETVEKAVRAAFAACEAEELVLLQLVHMHQIPRRKLASLLGTHESGLSRKLKEAERKIADTTLRRVQEVDPHLELTWEDFLRLCEGVNLLQA